MPLYAPFGNAVFAQTVFGVPPQVSTATTLTVQPPIGAVGNPSPYLYSGLEIDWQPSPLGQFTGQVLIRSAYGIPTSIFDGTILVSQLPQATPQSFTGQFIDTGLRAGQFYYYALYVFSTELQQWVVSGTAQGLVLTDWGFGTTYQTWMPDWYLEQDDDLATPAEPQGPLVRFLELIGFETNWVRSEIETLILNTNVDLISGALLPELGANLGMEFEPVLGMARSRVLVKNAVFLYKNRGTPSGIAAAASAYSGYGAEVTLGQNLEIQLDDGAFDRSAGHWVPANSTTSITTVSPVSLALTSQHAQYDGAPPLGNTSLGYLPPNNNNVAAITSGSAAGSTAWSSINPALSPAARTEAMEAYDTSTASSFLFGGSSVPGLLNDMWSFSGTSWTNVTPAAVTLPNGRSGMALAYFPGTVNKVIAFGGVSGSTYYNDTWSWDGTTWTQLAPANSPSARTGHAMVYAAASGDLILFGGINAAGSILNDTWVYNGITWGQIAVSGSPDEKYNHGMAYNTATGRVLLFGGTDNGEAYEDDTWSFNPLNNTWSETSGGGNSGQTAPSARIQPVMAYDAASSNIVLFGGYNGTTYLSDTWTLTGSNTWTVLSPASHPTGRAGAMLVYDSATAGGGQHLVLFGGYNGSTYLSDTWTWNGTTWAVQSPGTSPPGRSVAGYAYDTLTSTFVVFGGAIASGQVGQDTWSWNGTTWAQGSSPSSPPVRSMGMLAYDVTHNQLVLFGGFGALGALNDTWTWSGTSWTQKNPGTTPSARYNGAMCWDATSTTILMHGGQNAAGTALNEMWSWNGTTWSSVVPATLPGARYGHQMVNDPTTAPTEQVVLYGGQSSASTYLADTWTWNGTTWANQSQAGPGLRSGYVMAYDAAAAPSQQIIMFGGQSSASTYLSDTWTWNGTTWSLLATPTHPSARTGASVAYSSALGALVMFGGNNASGNFADTWFLTGSAISGILQLSTCTPANATTLGIPIAGASAAFNQATPKAPAVTYVLSAYFQPAPQATPTVRSFQMRIDWYGVNGVLISSTTGAAVADAYGKWTRASVVGSPPAGAFTFGRTILSTAALSGDIHLLDAVQTEVNSLATPGPTTWDPPRDIKVNLFPLRQNLIADPVGFGSGFGWTTTNGSNVSSSTQTIIWPATTTAGYLLTANGAGDMIFQSSVAVNPKIAYTFSCYLRPAAAARTVFLVAQWYTAGNAFISQIQVQGKEVLGSFTQMVNADLIAPQTAAKVTLQIIVHTPSNTEGHYVGAIMFEPLGYLRPYFDANFAPFTDYIWEGTPNQSISDYYPNQMALVTRLTTALPDYVPIGSTFSIITGATALTNSGFVG